MKVGGKIKMTLKSKKYLGINVTFDKEYTSGTQVR